MCPESQEAVRSSNNANDTQPEEPQLALPAPGSESTRQQTQASDSDNVKHTIRFDSLGPLVINKDGTLSRINNWAEMTGAERERIVRVLGKRNMLRKDAILNDESAES